MLNGSENAVTGLLASLFQSEGIEKPLPTETASPSGRSEQSPEVLAAFAKAQANFKKPAFSDAFEELMDTTGADGQTPKETILKLAGKRMTKVDGVSSSDIEDVVQDANIKIMNNLVGSAAFKPDAGTFNGWVTRITLNTIMDFFRARGGEPMGGLGGGADDGHGAPDPARDRRNEPVHDPMAHMYEFTPEEQKYCDFIKGYLTKVLDGSIAFPHELKAKKSRDPEYADADALPPELKAKRLTALGIAKVFAFMSHHGLGSEKLKLSDLAQQLSNTYGLHKFTPYAGNQWYKTLWPVLEKEFALAASSLGIDDSKEHLDPLMNSFRKKLTIKIQSQKYGKAFCEDDLADDFSDLLSVLESWHAASNC